MTDLKFALIRCLSSGATFSKSELARSTGFRIPSITKVLEKWKEEGFVIDLPSKEPTWGKHSGYFQLNPSYQTYFMLHIRPDYLEGGLCNALGETFIHKKRSLLQDRGHKFQSPQFLWDNILALMSDFDIGQAAKICVASHGTIMPANFDCEGKKAFKVFGAGIVLPHLGWQQALPIQQRLEEHFDMPVAVESDCITLSYNQVSQDSNGDFVFLHLGYGIAASVVLEYRVLGASKGTLTPGQIGHSPMTEQGKLCKCGTYGCLETLATPEAILNEVERELQKNSFSSLAKLYNQERALHFSDIVAAVEQGDHTAQRVCSNAIHYIALSLVNVIHLLNLPKIYLWGELTSLGNFLLKNLYDNISHNSVYQAWENTNLEIVDFAEHPIFRGLALMELYQREQTNSCKT